MITQPTTLGVIVGNRGFFPSQLCSTGRAEVLAALECVDFVTIFPETRATQFIRASRPSIYVKGGDYTSETLNADEQTLLRDIGAEIRIIPFVPGYSTSHLIEQVGKTVYK